MQATAEPLEGNRVKLSVEVAEDEFAKVLESAVAEVAATVRLPGFRPGHVPKKVVEARIGKGVLREEALRDSMPGFVRQAVADTGTDAIGSPEVEVTSGPDDFFLTFDAIVEVRPRPTVAGYAGLRVTIPASVATDEEVDGQLDRMRDQFGELNVVTRPAKDGDHVTIDVQAYRHSEAVEGLSVEDFLYEVGSAGMVEGLDEQLQSAKAGDIFKFNAVHPVNGEEVSFQVLVKEVKEKLLPEADDDWASQASEFSTLTELRQDIARRIGEVKKIQAKLALRSEAAKELSALVTDDLPEVLIGEEMQIRLADLQSRLEAQRVTAQQYLAATGQDAETFSAGLREAAAETVRLDLALRSLAEAEGIVAEPNEVQERIELLGQRSGRSVAEILRQVEDGQGLEAVRWEIRKSKALEWLEGNVEIVDEDGNRLSRELLDDYTPDPEGSPGKADGQAGGSPVEADSGIADQTGPGTSVAAGTLGDTGEPG